MDKERLTKLIKDLETTIEFFKKSENINEYFIIAIETIIENLKLQKDEEA